MVLAAKNEKHKDKWMDRVYQVLPSLPPLPSPLSPSPPTPTPFPPLPPHILPFYFSTPQQTSTTYTARTLPFVPVPAPSIMWMGSMSTFTYFLFFILLLLEFIILFVDFRFYLIQKLIELFLVITTEQSRHRSRKQESRYSSPIGTLLTPPLSPPHCFYQFLMFFFLFYIYIYIYIF